MEGKGGGGREGRRRGGREGRRGGENGARRYSEKEVYVCVCVGGGGGGVVVQTDMLVYSQEPAVKSICFRAKTHQPHTETMHASIH